MHVSFALFADAANISQEGKLNILGVFDALQVGALPTVHPRATLIVRLKALPDDVGRHTLAFAWIGPGGDEHWSSSGELEVGAPPPGATELDVPVIAAIDLPIHETGTHVMRVALDGDLCAELLLHVRSGGAVTLPPMGGMVS
ncbi:MAG: hypothetical protein IPJ78_02885 [Gemmatimonadetes bacterium]|jgi:hypothetical protein|nr:hypothetical protein [Gemmatimonadota bacterium]MBP7549248.1 hypothetical protein [Gemmatimonadaceae bacterium]